MSVRNVGTDYLTGALTSADLEGTPTATGQPGGPSKEWPPGCWQLAMTVACTAISSQTSPEPEPQDCRPILITAICTMAAEAQPAYCNPITWTIACTYSE
jgi:hypothetical protein